jgi:streptomycin 6-kinase
MRSAVRVPLLVRQRALANGKAGQEWLDRLPEVLDGLVERWGLELGNAFSGGSASYVVAVTDGAGRRRVLKVGMPLDMDDSDAFARSVRVHQLARGRGCAQLFDHEPSAPAMLLERLGPNLDELGMSVAGMFDAITMTLREFWQPVGTEAQLPTGADKAQWLAGYITKTWEALGRPCPQTVIDRALGLCERRAAAFDPDRAVLVHGDPHGWNTLEADRGSFKFVDPEGIRSEPEHDLSVAMREYNEPLMAGETARLVRKRAEGLAARCDVSAEAVWEWGFIERVSTGLANLREFDDDIGRPFLTVAERCP